MNIALGAVFIFILLLPPIALYVSYNAGPFAKAGPRFSLLDGVLASAILSLFIHAFAVWLIPAEIRFDILIKLLGGELKGLEGIITNRTFDHSLRQFALYNAAVLSFAVALGRGARYLVKRFDLHFRYELLRLHNKWWYLFNGYYLTEIGAARRDFDLLFVDVVVDTHDGTMIYSGYLVEFVCNGEDLERIYLNDTIRREWKKKTLQEDGKEVMVNEPGTPVNIPGEFFAIAHKEIRNLNLRFIQLTNTLEEISGLSDVEQEEGE